MIRLTRIISPLRLLRRWPVSAAIALGLGGAPAPVQAQFGGQPGGMPSPQMRGAGDDQKADGPAEEAPEEEKEQPGDMTPLGSYPGQARRTRQIIEMDGYFRFRGDYLYKLHMNQGYLLNAPGGERPPPHPLPLECAYKDGPCNTASLGSANMRLRLEPTVNVTDQVRVQAQVDVLDNTIAGSTADSLAGSKRPGDRTSRAPIGALSNTQDPPEVGQNGLVSSIRAKRAWGEVESEYGTLWFGRMPWHFGRGMTYNNGNCPDCDGGTTVDRVMVTSQVYGHNVSLAWDFGAQGYHAGMTDLGRRDPNGPPLDLSQGDDVMQLMASMVRYDDERRFLERAQAGELMLNYGVQLVFRDQSHEMGVPKDSTGRPLETMGAERTPSWSDLSLSLDRDINAMIFLPSLWFKMGWKILTIEAEANAVLGRIANGSALLESANPDNQKVTLQQLGWVVASELRLFSNAFFLAFETGGATGDQAENNRAYLNYRWKNVRQPAGDNSINDFKFSPEYHVDQILFRRILGTVSNAIYVKPSMTYWLNLADPRQLGLSAALIYSLAPVPASTPGNSISYGLEANLGVNYRNPADGFFAGVNWGVFWPMGALDRRQPVWPVEQDAEASQVLRGFAGIRF